MKYKFSQSNFNDPNYRDFSKSLLTTNDLSNKAKIANEIKRLDEIIATGESYIKNEKGIDEDIKSYKSRLQKIVGFQYPNADKTQFKYIADTDLYKSTGGQNRTLDYNDGSEEQDLKRQLAAVEALIRETKKNKAALDAYWMRLLSNKGFSKLSNSDLFIKTADDMNKEADKVTKKYYNDLYDDSEGSPNYGDILEHPEDYHHTLTTEASQKPKSQRFKKV